MALTCGDTCEILKKVFVQFFFVHPLHVVNIVNRPIFEILVFILKPLFFHFTNNSLSSNPSSPNNFAPFFFIFLLLIPHFLAKVAQIFCKNLHSCHIPYVLNRTFSISVHPTSTFSDFAIFIQEQDNFSIPNISSMLQELTRYHASY